MKAVRLLLIFLSAIQCNPAHAAPALEWDRQPESLALRQGGQIVWRFNFGTNETKPSFHPLAVAGGPVLSAYRPKDHP